MTWFLGGIAFLALGYFTYGKFVERLIPPDDRATPCVAHPDGVDCVPLPKWKNNGLYPFFSLLKIQPSGTAFAPAKSYTFKR